ncbi:MAG: energy transducer TonB [Nitrospirae bacterium]|nr:energy transducer TonB [Nitrospirota bacterium]
MSYTSRAAQASFAVHAVIVLALAMLGGRVVESKPVVIDFTIEDSAPAGNPAPVASAAVPRPVTPEPPQPEPVMPKPPAPEPIPEKIVTAQAVEAAPVPEAISKPVETVIHEMRKVEEAVAVPPPPPQPEPVRQEADSRPAPVGSAPDVAAHVSATPGNVSPYASIAPAGIGNGTGAGSAESSKSAYIKLNFSYIKEMVQKRITYPAMARRMGWEGKVVVAFLVRADGGADNVRVVESAGYEALNKNTIEAVRQAVPFPRPPVEAEIILPIVYRLN